MRKKLTTPDGFQQTYNYGEDHPNWINGKSKRKDGYILINTSQDPMFEGKVQTLEHRYVMAKAIGRKLNKDEHVHHKNGNRSDNRLENLEIISPHDHWVEHHGYRKGTHPILKERFCALCNKKFYPAYQCNSSPQKYCSLSCSTKVVWQRDGQTRKKRQPLPLAQRTCAYCKKEYYISRWRKTRFCSLSCSTSHKNTHKKSI